MKFAKKFMETTAPIVNEIKSAGYKVYVKEFRDYEDGVVPKSMFVPGLNGKLLKTLAASLFEYDSPDKDYRDTILLTNSKMSLDGWEEL